MRKALLVLLSLLVLTIGGGPALAHKLKVFAAATGATVSGYVYIPGGDRVVGAPVRVEVQGRTVATLASGPDGAFSFQATTRADHRVTATIDGHQGVWTVRAAELPATLPTATGAFESGTIGASAAPETETPPAIATASTTAVEQAVARQLAPLRAELQEWREEARWRDVAGGLGWLIGLFGLAAWMSARRKGG